MSKILISSKPLFQFKILRMLAAGPDQLLYSEAILYSYLFISL